jgi:hypothetical protein
MILRNLTNGERCIIVHVFGTRSSHNVEFYKFNNRAPYKYLYAADSADALSGVLKHWGFPSYELDGHKKSRNVRVSKP